MRQVIYLPQLTEWTALVERYSPAMEVMSSLADDDRLLSDERIRDTADAMYAAWQKWSKT